jgi:HAD superfamily hydrolase (TIGR01509 family)
MINHAPKIIFFDLGDTLVHFRQTFLEEAAGRIRVARGLTPDPAGVLATANEFSRALPDEWQRRTTRKDQHEIRCIHSAPAELQYWRTFYRSVLRSMGLATPPADVVNWLAEKAADPDSFECFSEVKALLQELQQKGMPLGILSNAFPSAKQILVRQGLDHFFQYTVLSYEEHLNKPNCKFYRRAAAHAGVKPEEAVFVDDRLKFVQGAKHAGMQPVWIVRDQKPVVPWKGRVIPSLSQLCNWPEPNGPRKN